MAPTAQVLSPSFRALRYEAERAHELLQAGEYGWCEDCGAPIGFARLSVSPAASRCVACQGAHERPGRGAVSR